jgi:hypothetical protein
MAHSDDLYAKAQQLRNLADDLEDSCDRANTAAAGQGWDCDNATEVREAIRGFRGAAQNAAQQIRAHAHVVEGQARTAADDEREARQQEQEQSRRPGPQPAMY